QGSREGGWKSHEAARETKRSRHRSVEVRNQTKWSFSTAVTRSTRWRSRRWARWAAEAVLLIGPGTYRFTYREIALTCPPLPPSLPEDRLNDRSRRCEPCPSDWRALRRVDALS